MNRACITYDCIRAGNIEARTIIADRFDIGEIVIECDLIVPCNLFVGGSAFVGEDITVERDLFVRDDAIVSDDLTVLGDSNLNNAVVNNALTVNGEANFNYITNINSNLTVTGNTNLNTLTVFGDASFRGRTVVEDEMHHNGSLIINGDFITDSTGLFEVNRRATFTAGFDAELTSTAVNLIVTGNFNSGTPMNPGSATFFGGTTFIGPVTFTQCPTFPPGCSFPLSTNDESQLPVPLKTNADAELDLLYRSVYVAETNNDKGVDIVLDNANGGYLLDLTESNNYTIIFGENISTGIEWEIYVSSNRQISILNQTQRMISVSGFVQEDGDSIFIPRDKNHIYHSDEYITCMEASDIQSAYYKISLTYVDDTDVRLVFRAIFR